MKTPTRNPPRGRRACLCDDNTYSIKCCDGSLQAQGIGNITGINRKDLSGYVFALNTDPVRSSIVVLKQDGSTITNDLPELSDFVNANEILVEGSVIWIIYKWSGSGEYANRIVRLEDVSINGNSFTYTIAEDSEINNGVIDIRDIHGTCGNTDFIYASSRSNPVKVAKISKYNFNDIEIFEYPNDGNYKSGDICFYYDGNVYVQTTDFTYTDKVRVLKINDRDLSDYSLIINDSDGAASSPQYIGVYNGNIILCRGAFSKSFTIEEYNTQGELLRSSDLITYSSSVASGVVHSGLIQNDSLFLATLFSKVVLKINLTTLTKIESVEIPNSTTDDLAIGKNGFIYVATENHDYGDPYISSPFIYKINPTTLDFSEVYEFETNCFSITSILTNELKNDFK